MVETILNTFNAIILFQNIQNFERFKKSLALRILLKYICVTFIVILNFILKIFDKLLYIAVFISILNIKKNHIKTYFLFSRKNLYFKKMWKPN